LLGQLVDEFVTENGPDLPIVGKLYMTGGLNPHVAVAVGPMPCSDREWMFLFNPTLVAGGQIVDGVWCYDIAEVEEVDE
jgi:hypothetical protein